MSRRGKKTRTGITRQLHKSFIGYVLPLTGLGDAYKGGGEV